MTAPMLDDPFLVDQPIPFDVEDQALVDRAEPDADAPHGRKPDGTPYRMSPERRAQAGANLAAGRREAAKNGRTRTKGAPRARRASTARPSSGQPPAPNYQLAAETLVSIPVAITGILGRFSEAFAYDSMALSLHGQGIADALVLTAGEVPAIAGMLESAGRFGPWGALMSACAAPLVQILANHRIVPAGTMGALSRDQLFATAAPAAYAKARAAQDAGGDDGQVADAA